MPADHLKQMIFYSDYRTLFNRHSKNNFNIQEFEVIFQDISGSIAIYFLKSKWNHAMKGRGKCIAHRYPSPFNLDITRIAELLCHVSFISVIYSIPVKTIDEIIDIARTSGAILMVIGMFKYITGYDRNSTPYRTILVFVNKDIKKTAGIQLIEHKQSPTA